MTIGLILILLLVLVGTGMCIHLTVKARHTQKRLKEINNLLKESDKRERRN